MIKYQRQQSQGQRGDEDWQSPFGGGMTLWFKLRSHYKILKTNLVGSLDPFGPLPNVATLNKTPFPVSTINVLLNWLTEDGHTCLGAQVMTPKSDNTITENLNYSRLLQCDHYSMTSFGRARTFTTTTLQVALLSDSVGIILHVLFTV